MSLGNCVTPGTNVSVSTSVKWGCKTLLFLPPEDAVGSKIGFLDLGLQEVHELGKNDM